MQEDVTSGKLSDEVQETTVFKTDANIVKASMMKPLSIDRAFLDSSPEARTDSIKEFLGKPFRIQAGVFSTTDTVSTFTSFLIPDALFAQSKFSDKVAGFYGIRATTKIRIVFNATRFQQGRYMLLWYPHGGSAGNNRNLDWYTAHTNTLTQRTQCQRVEFDLSCDSEAILELPYRSVLNFSPISIPGDISNFGQWGRFCVFPYEPLTVDTGAQTCSFSVYVSLQDVELIGAAVPQSGRMGKTTKKKSPTEVEAKSKGIGPVESAMSMGYDISTALTSVPVLSTFALPASWIFDAFRGTAAHFGWSKPSNLNVIQRVVPTFAPYFGSVDNDDSSLPLSACVNNLVDPALGFSGTDIDELDFKFFAQIPAFIKKFTWSVNASLDTSLWGTQIHPGDFSISRPLELPGVIDITPINFVCRYFKYWRGSVVFTFKFVKTEFHSGRLSFSWYPSEHNYTLGGSVAASGQYWLNRHIVDIRECNEFTLTIPYLNSAPWLDLDNNQWAGNLYVFVEDKLVAPSTVPQSITVLVEVSGGPDFEVAFPRSCSLTPVLKATPQSGTMDRGAECGAGSVVIGNSEIVSSGIINSAFCIGERISSFRSLLKMFDSCVSSVAPAASSYKAFNPFAYPVISAHASVPTMPHAPSDLYGTLSSCFLFSRGGVRLKMVVLNDSVGSKAIGSLIAYLRPLVGTSTAMSKIFYENNFTVNGNAANAFEYGLVPKVLARVQDSQPLEISCPQYGRYHSRPNNEFFCNTDYPVGFGRPALNTQWVVDVQPLGIVAVNAYRAQWFRAAGEDCNMGGFISIPPMAIMVGGLLN
uniref:Picornavirus capsid domain-containing protein n=2 Tax=Picornavirales sp. TaxID=1955153 RepID=A0A514DB42_9VIRU|nr:MAG: hypothetical protein H1RhizoLitter1950_000002 [Picornavirales sp.]QDH90835.1 MAG: hypothetical protein H2BulkLitter111115_000001 [Picornavirales sp.]